MMYDTDGRSGQCRAKDKGGDSVTRDVLLTISGLHTDVDSENPVEVITAADYFLKNGKHYVVYTEPAAEGIGEVKNTIKISHDIVEVIKHGGQNSHMVFKPYEKNISCYETPMGSMIIGVNTLGIDLNEREQSIEARINYALEINDAHVSDCEISLEIQPREKNTVNL